MCLCTMAWTVSNCGSCDNSSIQLCSLEVHYPSGTSAAERERIHTLGSSYRYTKNAVWDRSLCALSVKHP